MDSDLEKIEEDLKKGTQPKKVQKKSGRSVFKLQEIIKEKSKDQPKNEDKKVK